MSPLYYVTCSVPITVLKYMSTPAVCHQLKNLFCIEINAEHCSLIQMVKIRKLKSVKWICHECTSLLTLYSSLLSAEWEKNPGISMIRNPRDPGMVSKDHFMTNARL